MLSAVGNRLWRHYADLRRVARRSGSAQQALDVFGGVDRSSDIEWLRTTSEGHEQYRRRVDPVDADVAIVCVSNRPQNLENVMANVARQRHDRLELVYVDNSGTADLRETSSSLESLSTGPLRCTFLSRSPEISLGTCLNAALRRADARFVAKFDDDDVYGAEYLADALRAHRYAGAGVVGKHTYYAHLEPTDEWVLRFPGHEFTYSSTLAGGTLVIDRDKVGGRQFEDISIGEDRAFIAACHRAGVSTFSADRFNFVQRRGEENTWRVDRAAFLRRSLLLDDPPGRAEVGR